jgi:hypothetical protein
MPSVAWLRHRDPRLDGYTKRRYHDFLASKIPGWAAPTADSEAENPSRADEAYASASRWLRENTRDVKKYPRVADENISYGFRRNSLVVELGRGIDGDHDPPFEPLGEVHRHDRDRIGFRIGPAFDLGLGVVPVASHSECESRETTAVISARHLQEQFGIGEGAFGSKAVARPEDRANVEFFRWPPRGSGRVL